MSALPDHRFYYLHNFQRALGWLQERYGVLLSDEERSFIAQFGELPREARALLVRLIMRRGPLFRESKIRYEEIADVQAALAALQDSGWVDLDPPVSIGQLAALIPKAVLAEHWNVARNVSKAELCAGLEVAFPHALLASQWTVLAGERLIEVEVAALCERLKLLFFGNFHQDWKEFVLSDLGIFKYESIEMAAGEKAFDSRDQIEAFYALADARKAFENDEPLQSVHERMPIAPLQPEWLEERRARMQFAIAREYERADELAVAFELYRCCRSPESRVRAVRVLEKQNRCAQAVDLIESYLAEPLIESDRERLERAARRMSNGKRSPRASRLVVPTLAVQLQGWSRVEEEAMQSLQTPDAPVFYVENLLLNGLFGLWCWDAVFASVPGAYFHPFQSGPADLYSPFFRERRREWFDRAFEVLDRNEHSELIRERFRSKQGIQNPFVFWGGWSESLLDLALLCIPATDIRCMFERMLADLEHHTSGFPDLVQFHPIERRYRFIEVKGPGDRLQDHQRRWMQFFGERGIPAAVCHVTRVMAAA